MPAIASFAFLILCFSYCQNEIAKFTCQDAKSSSLIVNAQKRLATFESFLPNTFYI